MIPRILKGRSLFWTFAATFFSVLLLASLLQFALGYWAIQRLEWSLAQQVAQETAQKTAIALQRSERTTDRQQLLRILRVHLAPDRALLTVFRTPDGDLYSARFIDGDAKRRLEMLLDGRLVPMHQQDRPPPRRRRDDDQPRIEPDSDFGDSRLRDSLQPYDTDRRRDQEPDDQRGDEPPPLQQLDDHRPPPRRQDGGRPPRWQDDQRPPRRQGGERPPRRQDGERPPRRQDGERPPRRQDGERPPRRQDDERPPRRQDDEKPPADPYGGRPTLAGDRSALLNAQHLAFQPSSRDDRRPPRPPRDRESFYPEATKWEELVSLPVTLSNGEQGEIVMVRALSNGLFERLPTPYLLLFFFPVSALVAGIAALLLFRLLLRRLKRLEGLTHQVANGQLDARVSSPGDDELGRLGQSLNQMTEALEQSSQKVAQAELQRRHLLADISHELATPLTSIRGYSETLLDEEIPVDTKEQHSYLSFIHQESVRMGHLIQDLLELARLEAGHRTLDFEPIDWASLCYQTYLRCLPQFRKAGLSLSYTGKQEGSMIQGDGMRLEQVLDNLLVNALRYVPHGCEVVLHFQVSPNQNNWQLEVSDNGRGIPEHDLPHIFDRFYRSRATRTSKGSGLGLAIVKELVKRHSGDIFAQRNSSGGATFKVVIPKIRQDLS